MSDAGRNIASDLAVVIPVHNRPLLVRRAVESVTAQLRPAVRIVVVDDGSEPGLDEASMDHPQVTVLHVEHGGVARARNAGVASVPDVGWVSFLDSDDEALPGWIDEILAAQESGASLFSCAARYEWDDGVSETHAPAPLWPSTSGAPSALFLAGTFAVTRELFESAGGYRVGLRYGENTDLGWRISSLLRQRTATCTSSESALVRVHARRKRAEPSTRLESAEMVLADPPDLLLEDHRLMGSYHAIAGDAAFRMGMRRRAVSHFAKAWRIDWRQPRHLARMVRALIARVPR